MTDPNSDAIPIVEEIDGRIGLVSSLTPADDGCIAKADGRYHEYSEYSDRACGVRICYGCGFHKGLARCYCGWAINGGNGRAELDDLGENTEWDY